MAVCGGVMEPMNSMHSSSRTQRPCCCCCCASTDTMAITRAKARALQMTKVVDCHTDTALLPTASSALLEPQLWSSLPEHLLLEEILTRVPVAAVVKFRCVCKAWHGALRSRDFLRAYAEARAQGPWFFMFTDDDYRDGSSFDPLLNTWHHIPLPALPRDETFFPAASAGGLICFGCYADGWKTFVVCNPLTRVWRQLPSMLNPPFRLHTVGMVVDADTTSYKVLVAGNSDIYEVYDSATNCWEKTCIIPPGFYRWHQGILCNGFLYSKRFEFDGLVAYDMVEGVWGKIQAPMPHAFDYHALVECQGHIYTVGGQMKNDVTKQICILQLERTSLQWIEVDSMPKILFEEFLKDGESFSCAGYSDLVMLYIPGGLKDRLVLLYDLIKKLWRRLPQCTLPEHCMQDGLLDGISFEPRLDAVV